MDGGVPVLDWDSRIAAQLRRLRRERGWSIDVVAERSGVSRASLSRLENAAVSGSTKTLASLAMTYGITLSRLIHLVEDEHTPLVCRDQQPCYVDDALGFSRRALSPPARSLGAEVLEVVLKPAALLAYDPPPENGGEHHLMLREGGLTVTHCGTMHELCAGDTLRYHLSGGTRFAACPSAGARYVLVIVR